MANLTDHQWDQDIALKPFVVIRAHHSIYSGWIPTVHANYKRKREAIREVHKIMAAQCVYCRIERWPNADGGEVVVQEFGVNPGIDAGVSVQMQLWAS